jgi:hypothetical protein
MGSNDDVGRLVGELSAERRGQLEGAGILLKPLIFIADLIAFLVFYWGYNNGFVISISLAILTHYAMLLGVAFPIGYVLGRRAARRLKADLMGSSAGNDRPALKEAVRQRERSVLNPYYAKIVFHNNLVTISCLALAWYVGRLSWPLAGMTFVVWLLLPFAIVWSWPEHSEAPIWGRTIIGAITCSGLAALAFIVLAR